MKRKTLISIAVIIIMLLNTIVPLFSVYAAETKKTVTFNSELYNALADYLMDSNLTGFTYNPALRTITGNFASVETLNLKESNVDDLTGIENFTNLKTLNLSGNKLSLDSNLEVLNGISSLKNLDLSTNQIDGFSWLTLDLETENFQNQEITAVKLIQLEKGINDSGEIKADYKNKKIVQEAEGLLAEFNLASRDLDIDTYLTNGQKWNTDGSVNGVQEVRKKVLTNDIDYNENEITLYKVYEKCKDYSGYSDQSIYNLEIKVVNSKNKYFGSKIDLYYIVYEDDYEGIVFKDENFYKVVKRSCYDSIEKKIVTKEPYVNSPNVVTCINRTNIGPMTIDAEFTWQEINKCILRFGEIQDNDGDSASSAVTQFLNWHSGYSSKFYDFYGIKENVVLNGKKNINGEDIPDGTYVAELKLIYNSENNTADCSYKLYEGGSAVNEVYYLDRNDSFCCYDKALTLVIKKDFLNNHLTDIDGTNEKIRDLTGLEKLVGLKNTLNLQYNYIDSIDRVLELEANKELAEKEIREEINALINRMTSDKKLIGNDTYNYIDMIKKYKDKEEELAKKTQEIAKARREGATEESLSSQLEAQRKLQEELDELRPGRDIATNNLKKIIKKMKKTWDKSNVLTTYLTPEIYEYYKIEKRVSFEDKEVAKENLIAQLTKLQTIENIDKIKNNTTDMMDQTLAKKLVRILDNTLPVSLPEDYEKGWINYYLENTNETEDNEIELNAMNKFFKELVKDEENVYVELYNDACLESYNWEMIYKFANLFNSNNTQDMLEVTIKLPRINTLFLSNNIIESIKGIEALTELQSLNVSDNLLTTIDDVNWEELTKLISLDLSKNQLTSIDKLAENPSLRNIDVSNCLLSGKFKFDFARYFPDLYQINFDGNYYDDISFLVDKYEGKAKKSDKATSIADYISHYSKKIKVKNIVTFEVYEIDGGIKFSFKNQKVTVDYGTIKNPDSQIVFDLPQIFRDIEEMDPYNTTFGIVPGDGSVDEYGKKVMFSSYQTGKNTGVVTVKNVGSTTDSVGLGTYCNIKYDVVLKSDDDNNSSNTVVIDPPNTPDDTDKPNDTDTPTTPPSDTPGTTENGEVELTKNDITISGDTNDEKFVYVTKPNATVKSLVKSLKDLGYTVNSVGNIENPAESTSRVYTKLTVSLTSKDGDNESTTDAYELVVYGDVDGDGDVDSIDSGYARALRYDKLYEDITDTAERSELMQAFKQTAHFKAADINKTGAIEKEDTRTLLFYRAGLISKF